MCGPTAMAVGSLAASGMQAYQQYQTGKYQADVANQNADLAEAQAGDAINRGNAEASKQRRQTQQLKGQQAAAMGAAGGDLSSGNALDIFGDTAQFGALDSLTTVNNAQREAYGYQVSAANSRAQADAANSQANFGSFATLLTAPVNAYGMYSMAGGEWNPFKQSKAAPITAAVGTKTGR
ncbi:hypothetical protein E1B77_09915 [Salmonella enterica subsp. enterica]|nr:hypothetical protein [Salmonella enterica subsp. enterica]